MLHQGKMITPDHLHGAFYLVDDNIQGAVDIKYIPVAFLIGMVMTIIGATALFLCVLFLASMVPGSYF